MFDLNEVEETCERLKAYPNLLGKIKGMLDLIEKEEVPSADDFEEALIPQVRGLGKEIVETWAVQEESSTREKLENGNMAHHSKKKSTGIPPSVR